jgi:hypothetical protein
MSEDKKNYNKYCNCKLYKIISKTTPEKIFYGATTDQLRKILSAKKTKYKQYILNNNVSYCPSFELIKNDDAEILLIEKFKCDDIDDYNKFIYDYINNSDHPNINNYIPEGYKKPIRKRLYYEKLYNTTDTDKKDIINLKKDIEIIKKDTESISDIMTNIKNNIINGGNIKAIEYKQENNKNNDNNNNLNTKKDNIKYLKFNNIQLGGNKEEEEEEEGIKHIKLNKSYKAIEDYNKNYFYDNETEQKDDIYNKDYYIINNKKYDIIDNKYLLIDGVRIEREKIDKYDLKNRKKEIKILEETIKRMKKTQPEFNDIKYINNNELYKKDYNLWINNFRKEKALIRFEED